MDIRDILLMISVGVAIVSLARIRIMFMLKGQKVNAIVKEYISPQGAFIPIMEFEYKGQYLNIKAKNGFKNKKYKVGSEVEIYYIPGYDKEVKIISDYTDIRYLVIFIVLGTLLVLLSILK